MEKIGFLGMGVMGLPMAKNVVKKCGLPVLGYDVVQKQVDAFKEAGGIPVSDPVEIYKQCDVILQILPTHAIIRNSVEQAVKYGKPGNVIVDMSSTAPDIILELYQVAKDAGMYLLDSPVSGGNPMAIAGTLAIMTGGDKEAFEKVKPVLECMGSPVYTGGSASGDVTKLVNNMIGGAILVAIAEGYAFAAKAGIDLQTTFEATRCGFAGGPMYDNKVPKIIKRDYTPGARIAVHRKDILNAKHYAHKLDVDTPLTDVVLHVMDWMNDNGHIDEDQAALVKYYEDKMERAGRPGGEGGLSIPVRRSIPKAVRGGPQALRARLCPETGAAGSMPAAPCRSRSFPGTRPPHASERSRSRSARASSASGPSAVSVTCAPFPMARRARPERLLALTLLSP